ncbi:GIY-YIG nuclease family protein [Luteimonas sp. MC1750]|nr:GIY-YIG nuclease family protein [Luteimonas sp. MC1750]QQO06855.1 GIY-YIG nuclease family protein [Luteimonas sp. MC1750]
MFDSERAVYIGQSTDPKRRFAQHSAPSGGWHRSNEHPLRMVILEEISGTYAQAERREFVWRWIAHIRWWRVYVLPPNVVVRLGRRMGPWRRAQAWYTMLTKGWPVRRQASH